MREKKRKKWQSCRGCLLHLAKKVLVFPMYGDFWDTFCRIIDAFESVLEDLPKKWPLVYTLYLFPCSTSTLCIPVPPAQYVNKLMSQESVRSQGAVSSIARNFFIL